MPVRSPALFYKADHRVPTLSRNTKPFCRVQATPGSPRAASSLVVQARDNHEPLGASDNRHACVARYLTARQAEVDQGSARHRTANPTSNDPRSRASYSFTYGCPHYVHVFRVHDAHQRLAEDITWRDFQLLAEILAEEAGGTVVRFFRDRDTDRGRGAVGVARGTGCE